MVRLAVDGVHTGPGNPHAWEGIGFLALVAIQFGTLALVSYLDWSRGRRWSA
jgi:hypothetical protein